MALITCPECGKQISDSAESCPGCGFPLEKTGGKGFPDLPTDLSIGKRSMTASGITGYNDNPAPDMPTGEIVIAPHKFGVRLIGNFNRNKYDIHFSQIISISEMTAQQMTDKSVVGRAVVGGVLLGPLGAIVGGISGAGKKTKYAYCFVLNYWDIGTKKPITISLLTKKSSAVFIKHLNKQL